MDPGVVVIGTSWGGLTALTRVLAALPADYSRPILVVQHRGAQREDGMLAHLQPLVQLQLDEPVDKQELRPGWAYFAPAGYHLLTDVGRVVLSVDERVNHARPSIDVLFESAAFAYGPRAVGVVLTGASVDGAEGLRTIKAMGGLTVVQSPETAEAEAMPRAAIAAAEPNRVLPLEEIGPFLATLRPPSRPPTGG